MKACMCRFDSDCPEHGDAALLAATPSVEPAGRLAVAASILLRVSETMMPERAACGHDRRWLLSLLDDLREALPTQASDSKETE